MSTETAETPKLPFAREGILDISPLYAELRRVAPVVQVRTPAGDPAWLATRYEEIRALWSDPRLGRAHPDPERASKISDAAVLSGPAGDFENEQDNHAVFRRLLTPAFSAKRMRRLEEHIRTLVHGMIDDMLAERGEHGPADLQEYLSVPLPVYVICELLGVPFADRHYFKDLSERAATMTAGQDARHALEELGRYVSQVAETKRREPGEDVISDLVAIQREHEEFTDQMLGGLAAALLFAGHETTVNRINFGVLLLLANPGVLDRLSAEPDMVNDVVEEILRLAAPGGVGIPRYAREDITLGDGEEQVTIRRGDAVLLFAPAANRDEQAFAEPTTFDPARKPNPHLSFGHGAHFCIGASLARTELRAVFGILFNRLPDLALAVEPTELTLHAERFTGGLSTLPVTY